MFYIQPGTTTTRIYPLSETVLSFAPYCDEENLLDSI